MREPRGPCDDGVGIYGRPAAFRIPDSCKLALPTRRVVCFEKFIAGGGESRGLLSSSPGLFNQRSGSRLGSTTIHTSDRVGRTNFGERISPAKVRAILSHYSSSSNFFIFVSLCLCEIPFYFFFFFFFCAERNRWQSSRKFCLCLTRVI